MKGNLEYDINWMRLMFLYILYIRNKTSFSTLIISAYHLSHFYREAAARSAQCPQHQQHSPATLVYVVYMVRVRSGIHKRYEDSS